MKSNQVYIYFPAGVGEMELGQRYGSRCYGIS